MKCLFWQNLRQNFSYISQDCFIFSGTIFENIAYVDKSITAQDVEKIIDQNLLTMVMDRLETNSSEQREIARDHPTHAGGRYDL